MDATTNTRPSFQSNNNIRPKCASVKWHHNSLLHWIILMILPDLWLSFHNNFRLFIHPGENYNALHFMRPSMNCLRATTSLDKLVAFRCSLYAPLHHHHLISATISSLVKSRLGELWLQSHVFTETEPANEYDMYQETRQETLWSQPPIRWIFNCFSFARLIPSYAVSCHKYPAWLWLECREIEPTKWDGVYLSSPIDFP